jgi:DNA recombination protein RmuC
MPDTFLAHVLFLILGLILGGTVMWLRSKLSLQKEHVNRNELSSRYVGKEVHQQLQQHSDLLQENLQEKEEEIRILHGRVATLEQVIYNLEDKLQDQKLELNRMEERARTEFENLSNRLLEEKSRKFSSSNQQQLNQILHPLREKIKSFEESIEKRFVEETRDRVSLKKEIEHLRMLNQQLSTDANNLASALKGDNKMQGDWGEIQLELLLQKAGLTKDIHYHAQPSFSDNGKQKRPDFIINLPDEKHLVIDSKVSLKAYDGFCNAENEQQAQSFLKNHLDSIRQHVKGLSSKNYQQLYQINSPDYLLLFVPIEPAFALAIQEDQRLFLDALDHNIVIVSSSTLLATMRTVSFIWKQEKQKNSVLEIARQSGMLYDKFCTFVEDLKGIGQRLNQAQNSYQGAMNKLVDSKKYGDTLVGRAERIRELGARTTKLLPKEMRQSPDAQNESDELEST